jgi:hypothetical protein
LAKLKNLQIWSPHLNVKLGREDRPHFGNSEQYCQWTSPFSFFLPAPALCQKKESLSVVSIVWAEMYAPYYGILQEYLKSLGIQLNIAPLGEPKTALFAMIVVNIWQWTGFSMIMYVAGLNNIPGDIFDAARIDGAHGLKLAARITVPLLSPVTRSLLLLGLIGTLQTLPNVYLMTDGGPDHASEVFGTYIFKQGFVIGDTGYSLALSTLVLIIALVGRSFRSSPLVLNIVQPRRDSVESSISFVDLAANYHGSKISRPWNSGDHVVRWNDTESPWFGRSSPYLPAKRASACAPHARIVKRNPVYGRRRHLHSV